MVYKDLQEKTYPQLRLKTYTPPSQIKQAQYTQSGVTNTQITKQSSYNPTNTDQEPHIDQSH
jgi:hypothetical protein